MTRRRCALFSRALFSLLWLLGSRAAGAADAAHDTGEKPDAAESADQASPESAAEEEARLQFDQGREFYNQGEFEKAAIALRRAFELRPSYKILYYLGWAENETGNYNRALTAFNNYLAEAENEDPPERIAEIKQEVMRLKARVGHLFIKCDSLGAKIKVDNETRGETPLEEAILVNIGKHEVVVMDGPEIRLTEVIRIAGGQEITLTVPPKKASPTAPPAAPPVAVEPPQKQIAPPADNRDRSSKRVWVFLAYGLSAGAAIGAAVTGALALDQKNDIWDQCDDEGNCYADQYQGNFQDDTDRLRTLGIVTDVLIGTAAAFAVAGTVIVIMEVVSKKERSTANNRPRLVVGPNALSISGRF